MSAPAKYDVVGIGNAIVDVLARVDETMLVDCQLAKGSMSLIDEARATALRGKITPDAVMSGGSAANTMAGLACFGARGAFIGKVHDDEAGRAFADALKKTGIDYTTPPSADGPATALCLVFVTPDGERTMSTYLGACQDLRAADLDEKAIADAKVLYLEGYLWDPVHAKDAFRRAVKVSHDAGRRVALSLSDAFCVDRYRDEFLSLIRDKAVDIVFCNESELYSLYQDIGFRYGAACVVAGRRRSGRNAQREGLRRAAAGRRAGTGACAKNRESSRHDGAGDLFAAGYLAGLSREANLPDAAANSARSERRRSSSISARARRSISRRWRRRWAF